jgi:hypothetical protein
MMIVSETPPAGRAPRRVPGQSARRRAMVVVAMFPLVAAFGFTGAPAVMAASTFTTGHSMLASNPPPPCRGDKPGVCPTSSDLQLDEKTVADQLIR